jgi:hypothetical protein
MSPLKIRVLRILIQHLENTDPLLEYPARNNY